jgi:hypothetical protein
MAISGFPIYLSTLLLEKNRGNGKGPTLLVSDWTEQIAEAGFAGLEIWMNHLLLASRSEWELIKERAQESDLLLATISTPVPADASDKSRRLRDAVVEACDYFRPDNLKFGLAEDGRAKGPDAADAALEFVKTWTRDVPREVNLLYDAGAGESGMAGLEKARKTLAGGRYKAVLHPFLMPASELDAALAAFGDFVGNLGVQAKLDGQWSLLLEIEGGLKIPSVARARNYKGTWTLEFTKGAGQPGENIDRMFDNAEKDLNFLLEALVRTSAEKK